MKKKIIKKLVSLFTLVCVMSTVFVFPLQAATLRTATQITQVDYDGAIKIIEKDFLIINNDGTFSINAKADKVVDKEILNTLKISMAEINSKIAKKELYSYKLSTSKSPLVREVNQPLIAKASAASGGTIDYIYHWYGFDACEDAVMAGRQADVINDAITNAALFGCGAGYFYKPCGLSAGITTYILKGWLKVCNQGAQANGVILYCLFSPSKPLCHSVQLR